MDWDSHKSHPKISRYRNQIYFIILDIQALCQIAKENNLISVVDNTFCSPYL